ncbi:probable Mitochondrial DNA replication protein YHM2 [Zygosaccharomyces bailii ISA1307]|nr:probable Mitochondrial DNA replication protein YHM2 [Zygosaccharomyces bailii ISA1307]
MSSQPQELKKKPISFSNILLGAGLNLAEVSTLGQPLEVTKTTMAAHRSFSFMQAIRHVWSRGGIFGFYQGLIPWAWIEGSTKGAVLLFVSAESEYRYRRLGLNNFSAGIMGGITGGLAQAYMTMGFCTCMKTVEITRSKATEAGALTIMGGITGGLAQAYMTMGFCTCMKTVEITRSKATEAGTPSSTWQIFKDIYRKEGIRGINKGVNAVAIRQMTNWGSRFGLARLVEESLREYTGKGKDEKLSAVEKIGASVVGGGLSAWNQPIEVVRVEMQSRAHDPNRPKNLTVSKALKYIYQTNGMKGLYRGVTPRIGLGVWQTVFMVGVGDIAREFVGKMAGEKPTAKH